MEGEVVVSRFSHSSLQYARLEEKVVSVWCALSTAGYAPVDGHWATAEEADFLVHGGKREDGGQEGRG